jgi:hypothetical protein
VSNEKLPGSPGLASAAMGAPLRRRFYKRSVYGIEA